MSRQVLFLGGNGHCAARLGPARAALRGDFDLVDVAYPGFEGRPRTGSLEEFLEAVAGQIEAQVGRSGWTGLLYGTGIGGLLALCLRAQDRLAAVPLLFQAPILWGLERRRFPRLMRFELARRLLHRLFDLPAFQDWFARRHFRKSPAPLVRTAFFGGYAACAALSDLFAWLTPDLLRHLEEQLRRRPDRLQHIRVWWGGRDRVVSLQELKVTEAALGVSWPVRAFPDWGHYPMMDSSAGWVRALNDELAALEVI